MRVPHLALLFAACASTGGLPPEAIAHNAAGAALLAEGHLDDAEARFRLALEYQPRFPEPRANLGTVAMARGQLEEAEAHLRGAIELNEDFAEAWSNLGIVLEGLGREGEAEEAYEEALAARPGLPNPRRNLAALMIRQSRFEPARAHLMRLVQVTPEDAIAQALLAYVEVRLGRPREGERRAALALAIDAEDPVALTVRGLARAHRGELRAAAADLAGAAHDPLVGFEARLRLAAVEALRGELAAAEALVAGLMEERPEDAGVHLVAAHLALARGLPRRARRHAERALDAAPDLREAQAIRDAVCAEMDC